MTMAISIFTTNIHKPHLSYLRLCECLALRVSPRTTMALRRKRWMSVLRYNYYRAQQFAHTDRPERQQRILLLYNNNTSKKVPLFVYMPVRPLEQYIIICIYVYMRLC